ncbi:sialidase family protein [Myxococcus qinghaiensis]|uniref:sialidase family protein n=1 Tax=Myxococcus qinghaiensis TaxID=2906758 RepID=UPI0020A7CC73|nr:sialidase family protein [Myxococcus qinghaiensis]
MASGGAPIRSITRRSDGVLIGGASAGTRIDVWTSTNGGASWSPHGSVANNPAVQFGDVTMRAIPGTRIIFCAFREYAGGQYRITITRSDNDGDNWVYDSTVIGPVSRFVGAPFLFQRANGDLQVYYDSEPLAAQRGYPGHQWIAMQGRAGISGSWTAYGVVAVAWDKRPGALNREGMPTVVQLGGDRLMVVVEGVEAFATGGARANVINAVQSWDGGRTWDESLRRTVYQSRIDPGSGRRYNAYVPYAIRVGNGPVGVAFCTDEDKAGPPDLSSAPVDQRNCHVGYVSTTVNFESWSAPSPVWTATSRNYTPGLYERALNDVIVVIDALGGNRVLQP